MSPAARSQSGRFVEVRGGLVGGEAQVGGPDLDQLAAHPPPGQRQVGVGAGAEHDVDVGREVLQQEGHALPDLGVVDQVVVVEDQPHLARCCGQLVEQRGERRGRSARGGCDELQTHSSPRRARRPGGRSRRTSRTTRARCPPGRARATRRSGCHRLSPRATRRAASSCRTRPGRTPASVSRQLRDADARSAWVGSPDRVAASGRTAWLPSADAPRDPHSAGHHRVRDRAAANGNASGVAQRRSPARNSTAPHAGQG